MAPEVTLLILNWNGKKWLEKFMPSVVATRYNRLTILVADNGSTDDSIEFLNKEYPQVKVLPLDKNYGFTQGNNLALPHISTPYFALLNSDVEVTPDWLDPLVSLMEAQPEVASVQPKILAYHQKDHFEYAGASGGYIDRLAYPFCRGRIFDTAEKDSGQYDDVHEVFWATGACSLLRKSVVDEIGLFEPGFFAHMEEIDFCWRAKNFGYRIMCHPASVVYHVGGGTLQQGNPRKTRLNVHNSLAMMYKNLPSGQVFSKIFSRLVLDGVWAAKSLAGGDFKTIPAIFKAHMQFYGGLKFWRKRRREIYGKKGPGRPGKGYYDRSIVWQYFAKGKRSFSSLPGMD